MPLVPVLARMERVGVGLDTRVLDALARRDARGQIDALRAEIYELAGVRVHRRLAQAARARCSSRSCGLPPRKRTKTGYSTDASVLAALAPSYPIADKILEYRELTKLKSTYIDALPRLLGEDGRLHTTFNQTVAATGRLSSAATRTCRTSRCAPSSAGASARPSFPPTRGDLMVSADYSQIELRILAHLSGDEGLIEAFTSGDGLPRGDGGARLRRRRRSRSTPEQRRAGEGGQLRHRVRASRRTGSPTRSGSSAPRRRR